MSAGKIIFNNFVGEDYRFQYDAIVRSKDSPEFNAIHYVGCPILTLRFITEYFSRLGEKQMTTPFEDIFQETFFLSIKDFFDLFCSTLCVHIRLNHSKQFNWCGGWLSFYSVCRKKIVQYPSTKRYSTMVAWIEY